MPFFENLYSAKSISLSILSYAEISLMLLLVILDFHPLLFCSGFFNLFSMKKPSLRANSLGTAESIIMGIAGSAPAFSIEATAFTLIAIA